jgi:hypothetical protein
MAREQTDKFRIANRISDELKKELKLDQKEIEISVKSSLCQYR